MKIVTILSISLALVLSAKESGNRFKKRVPQSEQLESFVRSLTQVELPKKILHSWQQGNPGKAVPREQVRNWLESGEAKLINQAIMKGLVISEKNSEHEQQVVRQLIYPEEFLVSKHKTDEAFPYSFADKNIGLSWSITFEPSENLAFKDRLAASYSSFLGKQYYEAPSGEKAHWTWKPIFLTSRFQRTLSHEDSHRTAIHIDSLGTSKTAILTFTKVEKKKVDQLENRIRLKRSHTISARFVKVSFSDWEESIGGDPSFVKMQTAPAWASKLISRQKATVLYSPSIILDSKQVGTIGDLDEVIYPTEYVRSEIAGPRSLENGPTPAAFDTKNVGLGMQLESDYHPSGCLLIRYSSYIGSYHGDEIMHRFFNSREWIADAWMPRFSHIFQKGIVALVPGEETLVGVSPAIDDEGNPDPQNLVLFFLKAE